MDFWGQGRGTLIGSMPYEDARPAVEIIVSNLTRLPCWPQLPRRLQEGMLVQFCEGLPGFVLQNKMPYILPGDDFESKMLAFYEDYLAWEAGGDLPEVATISPDRAPGLYLLEEVLSTRGLRPQGVKGQITGPFTLTTGIKKEDGEAAFYDLQLRDLIVKFLALKAAWQAQKLSSLSSEVVIFVDEPALAGFGSSSYVGISREEVVTMVTEVAQAIKRSQAIAGIHVCANTDWSLIFETGVKIVNLDAYGYLDRLLLFAEPLKGFLEAGGNLALGIVPTLDKEALSREDEESLFERLKGALEAISRATGLPIKDLTQRLLITPSCGMGTLNEDLAQRAVFLTAALSQKVAELSID